MKIIRNMAKCNVCNTTIESLYRHDFKACNCKDDWIAVDGGRDYLKRCGNPEQVIELSVCEEDGSVS